MIKKTLLTLTTLLLLGCNAQTSAERYFSRAHMVVYVDFEKWKEGRVCSELRFQCLPESQDKAITETPLENGLDSFELTPEVLKQANSYLEKWNINSEKYDKEVHEEGEEAPMFVTEFEAEFFDKVEEKRFLEEMESDLEKEFPGFWRDTPKAVRYRWIQRAMNKAKKFGYDPKLNNAIVDLCARIGLNFDQDPKYKEITEFIKIRERYIRMSCHYIDYTVFEKTHDEFGTKYTDWYFREISGYLPAPKRPLPSLGE